MLAVAVSVLLLTGTVLFLLRETRSVSTTPSAALPGPWQPPSVTATAAATVGSASPPAATSTKPTTSPTPTTRPTSKPTTPPTTTAPTGGPNLSLDAFADADGSSKADGTSFNDVRDGKLDTFWSPIGTTGRVSVKWTTPVTLSRVVIRQAAGPIRSWRLRNHDNDEVLATGTAAGTITFSPVALQKIDFEILLASGTPRVTEFQTFAE
ncbi:hypothetical protein Ate02nite_81260 [Paractinoplanes tereljensis]|uniref:Uncharacterized protein n=1 Tax=Paractinoplanes tereljensis TaxID=571912 RepID=A0A919NUB3_9ACTN|nr:hypothetical protein Ate02nite_81260 [Actinoplanes tereljensis]